MHLSREYSDPREHIEVARIPLTQFTELRVTKIMGDNGVEDVDVRSWYCTRKDPTMRVSQKGIRMNVENTKALVSELEKILSEV